MSLFGKNKFDAKVEKLRLISRIEHIQTEMSSHGLHKVVNNLDKVIYLLDDKGLNISKEQIVLVDTFLSDMGTHISKHYEALLLKKCEHIVSVVKGSNSLVEMTSTKMKNEDRLYEMLGELNLIDSQIKVIEKRMNEALGTDKNLWNMLNAQRRALTNRMMVLTKNYHALLESRNALDIAVEVKKAKEEAATFINAKDALELSELENNAFFVEEVSNEIRESTDFVQEVLNKNFGGGSEAFEYERALEQKLKEQNLAEKEKIAEYRAKPRLFDNEE